MRGFEPAQEQHVARSGQNRQRVPSWALAACDTFRPIDEFKRDMDRLLRELKATPPIHGQDRVYAAGEIEFETADERREHGIPLLPSVLQGLRDVGAQVDVPYDLE